MEKLSLKVYPLTSARWTDFETLFGPRGACGGCWCMWFRLKHSEYEKEKGDRNKLSMKKIVDSGEIPGILAYLGEQVVAWCSIGPRENYPVLNRSRILKPVDEKSVWSIVCFFVAKEYRGKGLTAPLLKQTLEFAQENGAQIVEGYPIDTINKNYPALFAATGFYSMYKKLGFRECIRRSETRPIMRYFIRKSD